MQNPTEDFISLYIKYTSATECPTIFHRWCAITCLAAYLGRRSYFRHGHFTLYPNLYTMLVGSPGTKKSSAIKIGAKLLKSAGYTTFAAKKTRQEKFLIDLAEQSEAMQAALTGEVDFSILEQNLFGSLDSSSCYESNPPAETLVAADEFNNFIGLSNMDFISILGELWDYEGVYDYKLKNSKSVFINNPTVNILGGNTPTGLSQAFPSEVIGQGFFSRLLLVFAEPTGIKYTFPPVPDSVMQGQLIDMLHSIKSKINGEIKATSEALDLLDYIYQHWKGLHDFRFEHYTNRRFTHLLKLCLTVSAARISTNIDVRDVVYANTVLTVTEHLMPKALGEFGAAKNSKAAHKVMTLLDGAETPLSIKEIWKAVVQEFDSRNQLVDVIAGLQAADKVQLVDGLGYLPLKQTLQNSLAKAVDWSLLTKQETEMV